MGASESNRDNRRVEAFTPGPWERDGIAIVADRQAVCLLGEPAQYAGDIPGMCANWEANARLIASCPDMELMLRAFAAGVVSVYQPTKELRFGGMMYGGFVASRDWSGFCNLVGRGAIEAAIAQIGGGQ